MHTMEENALTGANKEDNCLFDHIGRTFLSARTKKKKIREQERKDVHSVNRFLTGLK